MAPGTTILDLGSGSGEMLCSWARDHQIVGTGVDMSLLFSQQAAARAEELGVSDRVTFVHQMPADMSPASRAMLPPAWGHVDRRRGGRHNRAAEAEPYPVRHVAYRRAMVAQTSGHGRRGGCLRRAVTR